MNSTFYNFYKSIAAIKHIQRKGWLDIGLNGVVDTIASHSFAAALIGWIIAKKENLDDIKIMKLLLIHDLVMAYINDYTPKDKEYLSKKEIENAAIAELLKNVPEIIKEEFTSLISEYQEEKNEEAVLARECDKIETLLQAAMYSEKLAKNELSQFLSTYKEKIKSQTGLSILKDLKEEAKKFKNTVKALLIIDVQNWLMSKNPYQKEDLIATINTAIAEFRKTGEPIIFVQNNSNYMGNGTPEWEIYESLKIDNSKDIIVQKTHSNAFEDTELKEVLKTHGIDKIITCGMVTHGCVRATCIGGLKENIQVALLQGGHSNWAPDAKEKIAAVEKELTELGVKLIKTQDIDSV